MKKEFCISSDRFADSGGVKLRYRVAGEGEPLLLIMGYGPPSSLWERSLPFLVSRFKCVIYDHRGTGGSDTPSDGYSIPQFARDALAVLNAVGWESTHVYGGSMGGMVGQQLVLDAPERVRTLVIGSTTCGEPAQTEPGGMPEIVRGMEMIVAGNLEGGLEIVLPLLYGDLIETKPQIADIARKYIEAEPPRRLPAFSEANGWLLGWNIADRLHEISCPTLVQHGFFDRVFGVENAVRLFEGLPNSELRLYKSPHSYTGTDPERILRLVGDWMLLQHATREV